MFSMGIQKYGLVGIITVSLFWSGCRWAKLFLTDSEQVANGPESFKGLGGLGAQILLFCGFNWACVFKKSKETNAVQISKLNTYFMLFDCEPYKALYFNISVEVNLTIK